MNIAEIEEKIETLFGQDVVKYFKKKLEGSKSNQKGSRYEDFFALFKLIELFHIFMAKNMQNDIQMYTSAVAFVDDLLISDQYHNSQRHFQLKNTGHVRWEEGSKNSITDDFRKQKLLNDAFNIQNTYIFLVCSDEIKVQNLKREIPSTIENFSRVVFFPNAETLNHLLLSHKEFKEALKKICFSNESDKLELLAKIILGHWSDQKTTNNSVQELFAYLQSKTPNYLKIDVDVGLIHEAKNILSDITGFSYVVENGYFKWSYGDGLDSGEFRYPINSELFLDFQRKLIAQQPREFSELENILYESLFL